MKIPILAVFLFVAVVFSPCQAQKTINCNGLQTVPEKHAYCLLQVYKKLHKTSKQSFTFTQKLIEKGDSHFRSKNYDEASDAYDLAWSNSPNVYASIRDGDAQLLTYLTIKEFQGFDFKSTGSCFTLPNFSRTINFLIKNRYETSLELNKLIKTKPLVTKAMLAETRRKTICLKAMTDKYRQAKTGCADMEELRACIVPPK